MKYAIVYSSRTGNTKLLADAIRSTLSEEDCIYFGTPDEAALKADRIYVGFWTDKGNCNEDTAAFLRKLTNQQLFLFGTAGFGVSNDYFVKILDRTKKNVADAVPCIGTYMCQGKMPMSVRERYVKMSHAPVPVPNISGMIENFDKALSHPDDNDLLRLQNAVSKL